MAAGLDWAALPSVIIVEIFSYLSKRDRIQASSACRSWRQCLFHPCLWNRLEYELCLPKRHKSRFLSDRCGHFIRETIVKFNSHNAAEIRECFRILKILAENKNIQSFALQPSSCHIEWPESQPLVYERFLETIEAIIKNSRRLKHLSFGCVEELLDQSDRIIELLARNHANTLQSLHITTVKEDSENYGIVEMDVNAFDLFRNLQLLSIDYDHLSNDLLRNFIDGQKSKLQKLCIHVHGVHPQHKKITNETWRLLRNHCPDMEVTLNLIHSFCGTLVLLDILQSSMPLVHYRQFFCSNVNIAAVNFMSNHFCSTLKTVHIIDGYNEGSPNQYMSDSDEDPFVMLSWRCPKLEHFTLISWEIADDDVIAIARLRGEKLGTFDIPLNCIYSMLEDDKGVWVGHGCMEHDFIHQVCASLKREWKPLSDAELPLAVFDVQADAEKAYIDILHQDQMLQ